MEPCGMCAEAHHSIVRQRLLWEYAERVSGEDEVMSNNAVPSHEVLCLVWLNSCQRPELRLLRLRPAAAGVVWPQGRSGYLKPKTGIPREKKVARTAGRRRVGGVADTLLSSAKLGEEKSEKPNHKYKFLYFHVGPS
ncbi:hypothetical protein EYF80_013447 [Liparis tanakae]|uniref:Uncharacterized protein n=1 Tax=Liparis tanakae TaxID=230148 RepID=A0A4Z2IEE5_9TELE|nr:hypothetical protein EYF80_013447 [Liparis tanakae]